MRCLITGGAGFIGAALSHRLIQDGHQVRVLDDLSAGDPGHLPAEASFTRGDVRDRPKLWTLLQHVDCVFHLAARISVQESVLYPREYNDVNVGGTVSLAEAVRDAGVPRVVFASSATVYGQQEAQPVRESARTHPSVPYAVSKLAAEHYLFALGELCQFDTIVLRIFNAYGPGQRLPPAHAPVIPLFTRSILNGTSLVLHGDGSQTRDFVYIDDVVDALVAAAGVSSGMRTIINVGSGVETSIHELVATLGAVTGQLPDMIVNPQQRGGLGRLVADLSLADQLLGYRPRVSLAEGIARMVAAEQQMRKQQAVLGGASSSTFNRLSEGRFR